MAEGLPLPVATMPSAVVPAVVPAETQTDMTAPQSWPQADAEAALLTSPRPSAVVRQVIDQADPAEPTDMQVPVMPPAPAMPPVAVAPIPAVQPMMTAVAQSPRVNPAKTAIPVALPRDMPHVPAFFDIPAHPDADSVAAKLQRIRAVVGRGTVPAAAQDYAEDLGESGAMPDTSAEPLSLAVKLQSLSESWNDLEDTALAPDLPEPEAKFDMASVTAAQSEPSPLTDTVESQQDPVEPSVPAQPAAPVRARVIRVRRADFDAATTAATAVASVVEPIAEAAPDSETQPSAAQGADDFADPDDVPDLDGIADLMALDGAEDTLAMDADDLLTGAADADPGQGTLAPEAEADLLEELAALERDAVLADDLQGSAGPDADDPDMADAAPFSMANVMAASANAAADDTAAPMEADIDPDDIAALFDLPPGDDAVFDFSALTETVQQPAADALSDDGLMAQDLAVADQDADVAAPATAELSVLRLGRDLLEREPEADAEAMERIISQTDAELNSPENSRRREAISQLKAAVAATEAARKLGEPAAEPEADDVETAFRDDLKQVVRPRRPIGEVSADLRSERPRPAPLKLVASQRIDIPPPRPAPKSVLPVRPRRVSVQDDQNVPGPTVSLQAGSFAEFAASMGATQLPDLLEAAAAYTSFVEGVEDFSRPQLMKKVQDMAAEDYSREDGLRSFGTLLRQGRIMKTANGRFVVSEESRFNPERKSA